MIDPSDPGSKRRVITLRGGGWGFADWSFEDTRAPAARADRPSDESSLWLIDVANGGKRRVTPEPGTDPVAWGGGRFAADGKTVFVTTDARSEFRQLAALRIDGR